MGLTKLKLDASTDNVAISDGTDTLAVNADGSINVSVSGQSNVYAEDSVHTTGDDGSFALSVRLDARASTAGTSGDYAGLVTNANGELYTIDTDGNALLTTIDADTSSIATDASTIAGDTTSMDATLTALSKSEDAAHVTGDQGIMGLAVANHTEGALHSADGDYAPLQVDSSGRLRVIGDLDVVGNVADDAADSGNPLKIGGRAEDGGSVWTSVSAAGDRFDITGDLYRRVKINDAPNVGGGQGSTSVDTTVGGTIIAAATAGRTRLYIRNVGNVAATLGFGTVVSGTGLTIDKQEGFSMELGESLDLKGITASGSTTIEYLQVG